VLTSIIIISSDRARLLPESVVTSTSTRTTATTGRASERLAENARLPNAPLVIEADISLSVREHISQASGQAIDTEGVVDAMKRNQNDVHKENALLRSPRNQYPLPIQ